MLNSWWIAAFPGLAIFLTTLVTNLMGNALATGSIRTWSCDAAAARVAAPSAAVLLLPGLPDA